MILGFEGSVGAGKTTWIKKTFDSKRFPILYEPFTDAELGSVFEGIVRPFEFQISVIQRKNQWLEKNFDPEGFLILDRSFYGDWLMAFYYYLRGDFTREEWNEYQQLSRRYQERWNRHIFVRYVKATAEKCYAQFLQREEGKSHPYELKDFELWVDLHHRAFEAKILGLNFPNDVLILNLE